MSEKQGHEGSGPRMTGLQYEALCRHAISRIYGVAIDQIHGGHLAGASNSRQKIRHQIDLYWTASDGVCEYTVFANAKWSSGENLQMSDIMQLIGVWRDIGAHKAMLITNTGFDIGVRRQAKEKGIALLIVKPVVDLSVLGTTKLEAVVEQVERIAVERGEAVFGWAVVHKAWGMENGEWRMENGVRREDARAVEQASGGAVEEEGARGRGDEGEIAEGGMWLIGGGGGGGEEIEGVENKALEGGEIPDKMVRGVWKKG